MIQHFANCALVALIGIYFIRLVGNDYLWIKGIAYGAVIYYIIYGGIAKFVIPANILQPDLITSTIFMIGNLIFGLTSTLTSNYYLNVKT